MPKSKAKLQSPKATLAYPRIKDDIDDATLNRAAKSAYDRFVREAGFENDARIRDWEKLSYVHQRRWQTIARAVIESFRGVDRQRGSGDVQRVDERDGKLRHGERGAAAQKPTNRNRRARR